MPLICIIVWRDVRHHILHAVVLESIRCGLRIWYGFSAIGAEFCTGRKVFSAAAASDDRRQLCAAARAEKSARVTAENTTGWTLADFQEALMSHDLRSVLPDFFCGGADGRTHASQLLVYGDEYGVRDFITCENTDYAEDQNYDRGTFNKNDAIDPAVCFGSNCGISKPHDDKNNGRQNNRANKAGGFHGTAFCESSIDGKKCTDDS